MSNTLHQCTSLSETTSFMIPLATVLLVFSLMGCVPTRNTTLTSSWASCPQDSRMALRCSKFVSPEQTTTSRVKPSSLSSFAFLLQAILGWISVVETSGRISRFVSLVWLEGHIIAKAGIDETGKVLITTSHYYTKGLNRLRVYPKFLSFPVSEIFGMAKNNGCIY